MKAVSFLPAFSVGGHLVAGGSWLSDGEEPVAAAVLTGIAGLLLLVQGFVVAEAGSLLTSSGHLAAGGIVGGLGFLALLFGIVLLGLAWRVFANPEGHTHLGIGVLLLSVLALFVGGGFFVGSILGIIGGILAIVFQPEEDSYLLAARGGSATSTCPSCGASRDRYARFCLNCGTPI